MKETLESAVLFFALMVSWDIVRIWLTGVWLEYLQNKREKERYSNSLKKFSRKKKKV